MREELYADIWRYEAMTGLLDWSNEDDPGREERDRAAYGKEYGLVVYPDGTEYLSCARMLRFLVEVLGHSYDEGLEAIVEHGRSLPSGGYRDDPDVEGEAAKIKIGTSNIIEALFNLKVTRLIAADDKRAADHNRQVTRQLMAKRGPSRLQRTPD